jgi:putative oxidoreductase
MFLSVQDRHRDTGLLILRVGLGIMYMLHGYPKISGGVEAWIKVGSTMKFLGITMFPVFWGFMAAVTEFFGGAMIALGLFTRVVSFFLSFTMLVATLFKVGTGAGFEGASAPLQMLIVFVSLMVMGPGKYSLDAFRKR